MPSYARIPTIDTSPENPQDLTRVLNERIDEINRVFAELEVEVQSPADTSSFLTQADLEVLGLSFSAGEVTITVPATFEDLVSYEGPSGGGPGEFASYEDIDTSISDALEDALATRTDGEPIDQEDPAGVNGTIQGTPIMARDGRTGKARHLQALDGRLVVEDLELKALLIELIEHVKDLKNDY